MKHQVTSTLSQDGMSGRTNAIVIASYKYGHLAGHCIETVLEQTKKFDKIYFVDDGVGDCTHLPKIYPEVEYVLRETNLGTVGNFQDMLNRVTTDRVMFLGADNWLRPDTLKILDKSDADIVMYDIIVTGELKEWANRNFPKQITPHEGSYIWDRTNGHHGSMLYNVQKAKEVGYKSNTVGNTNEDEVLYKQLLTNGATVEHIPEALLYYRRHRDNYNNCR